MDMGRGSPMVPMPSQNVNMSMRLPPVAIPQQALFQPQGGYTVPIPYRDAGGYASDGPRHPQPVQEHHYNAPLGNENGFVGQVLPPPINTSLTLPHTSVYDASPRPAARANDGPPPHMTTEMQLEMPGAAGRGRGRGKKSPEYLPPLPPVLGKGRAATQGVVIAIEHKGRQKALEEQARKRKRVEEEESEDDTEERELEAAVSKTMGEKLSEPRKPKLETKGKRDHHACDRCFRNKTKCHRQIDGKPPGKHYPCDYCTSINAICTTAVARAKKPEAWSVAEEQGWKFWKFKDIISQEVEDENQRLRREVGNFQEKIRQHERLSEAKKSELATEKDANKALKKALDSANGQLQRLNDHLKRLETERTRAITTAKQLQRSVERHKQKIARLEHGYLGPESVAESAITDISVGKALGLAIPEDFEKEEKSSEDGGPNTSANFNAADIRERSPSEIFTNPKKEFTCQDILSIDHIEIEKRDCNEMIKLNEYLQAYFNNVHPLVPILHKAAFLSLYKIYAPRAIADRIREIPDASTPEGRAVGLICAVLALGAMSLVETKIDPVKEESENGVDKIRLQHYGEAMGFYKICCQLTTYAYDALETMLTFLLMSIFAVEVMDLKEAYRRLHYFQVQALALNVVRMFDDKEWFDCYDADVWPGVSCMVISEIVKRSWSVFKIYLSNVAIELGRRTNFDCIGIEPPRLVDDEELGIEADTIEDYGNAPNPIAFLKVLHNLSDIVDRYSMACWITGISTRFAQMGRFRNVYDSLYQWRQGLFPFLDWDKRNSALSVYLKLQRPFLEAQFRSLEMRVNSSIAHLAPLILTIPPTWDIGNAYSDVMKAVQRILDIIEKQGLASNSYHLYHWDSIKATSTLLHIFLRTDFLDTKISSGDLIATCQRGLQICRKLVASPIAKIEAEMELSFERRLRDFQSGTVQGPSKREATLAPRNTTEGEHAFRLHHDALGMASIDESFNLFIGGSEFLLEDPMDDFLKG